MFRTHLYFCLAVVAFHGFSAPSTAEEKPASAPDAFHELATRLLDAPTDADRSALLSASPELVTPSLESALCDQSLVYDSKGDFVKGRVGFQLARDLAERNHHPRELATALRRLGFNSFEQQQYDAAIDEFRQSLDIAERLGDQKLMVFVLQVMGAPYSERGDYARALEIFTRGRAIAESLGDRRMVANLLTNLGLVASRQGNLNAAIEYSQQAAATFESIGAPPRLLAIAYLNLGQYSMAQGDATHALEYYQRSLAVEGADATTRAMLLCNTSTPYLLQGAYAQALDYGRQCLELSLRIGNREESGNAYGTLAEVEQEQGDPQRALEHYQQALTLFDQINNPRSIAVALGRIGELQARQQHYSDALAALQRAMTLGQSIGLQAELAHTYAILAQVQDERGNPNGVLPFAQQAASLARKQLVREDLRLARTLEGRAYRRLGQPEQAREAFDEAIATVEEIREYVAGGPESQSGFFRNNVAPYHEMVELLAEQGQLPEALAYAERAKGRALLDVLVHGRATFNKVMTPAEREEEQRLQGDLAALNRQIRSESLRTSDEARLADLRGRLDKARAAYQKFQVSLYLAHPELKVQRGQAQPLSVEDAGRLLPDDSSAFIEYVVAEGRTLMFVLSRKDEAAGADLHVYTIDMPAATLAKRVQDFRRQLAERDLAVRGSGAELYQLLLGPARQQLAGKTALVVVPDGALWDLPFQALLDRHDRYLPERYALGYAPSLTVLREMILLHARHRQVAGVSRAATLFAMADPAFGAKHDTEARVTLAYRGEAPAPLPDTRREVAALGALYGREQSDIYVGHEARESTFKSEAGRFRVLHLATHGILDDASPMYSNVLLATGAGDKEDGLLEAWEIMQMDLKADLVVLSACETARGQLRPGEGVIGLAWAFFVAGTPTTIVSQWKVESGSTAALMLAFHRALNAGDRRGDSVFATARALQRAEVRLLRSARYAHPFYWAGFAAVGDPN